MLFYDDPEKGERGKELTQRQIEIAYLVDQGQTRIDERIRAIDFRWPNLLPIYFPNTPIE